MVRRSQVLALLASFLLLPNLLHAQGSQFRAGLWGALGLGYGSFGCSKSYVCNEHELWKAPGALSMVARVGHTLTSHWSPALEVNAWLKDKGDFTINMATATAVLFFRPSAESGFNLKGGLGVYASSRNALLDDIVVLGDPEFGWALDLGMGHDLAVAPRISVSPGVNVGRTIPFVRSALFPRPYQSFASRNTWQLVLALTWH